MKRGPHLDPRRAKLAVLAISAVVLGAAWVLSAGCSTARHHRVLSLFFDGVPEPENTVASDTPAVQANVGRQLVRVGEHGPYAAKLCDSCHDSKATNALIVPREQLCNRCHELGEAKAFVHGPLASGGCMVCHDPHSSANRFLLVSASDGFCLHCHDRTTLSDIGRGGGGDGLDTGNGHRGDAANCTDCHQAHMSDRKFLLR